MGCFQFGVYTWGIHVGGNSVLFFAIGKKNKTRGSQEPVIAHLVYFLIMTHVLINFCSIEELMSLPGIGAKGADKILEIREAK
jgi:hypothetical protein